MEGSTIFLTLFILFILRLSFISVPYFFSLNFLISIFPLSRQYAISLPSNTSYHHFSLQCDIHFEKSDPESHLHWQTMFIINSGTKFNRYLFPLDYYLDVIHWFCPKRWNKIFTYLWKISSQRSEIMHMNTQWHIQYNLNL